MPLRRVFVRGGHVFNADLVDFFPEPTTPRERAADLADAQLRWLVIVELMLAGQRITGGTCEKVIDQR